MPFGPLLLSWWCHGFPSATLRSRGSYLTMTKTVPGMDANNNSRPCTQGMPPGKGLCTAARLQHMGGHPRHATRQGGAAAHGNCPRRVAPNVSLLQFIIDTSALLLAKLRGVQYAIPWQHIPPPSPNGAQSLPTSYHQSVWN